MAVFFRVHSLMQQKLGYILGFRVWALAFNIHVSTSTRLLPLVAGHLPLSRLRVTRKPCTDLWVLCKMHPGRFLWLLASEVREVRV